MGSTYFWLDPKTGECHSATTHAQWLVANAERLGLQHALADLDSKNDEDAIHLIGIRSGLIRVSDHSTMLSVQFHAAPKLSPVMVHTLREFLRERNLPAAKTMYLRNCLNGNERIFPIRAFVDPGKPTDSSATKTLSRLVACHLVLLFLFGLTQQPPVTDVSGVLFLALLFSQLVLVALWLGMTTKGNWTGPLAAVVAFSSLLALIAYLAKWSDMRVFAAISCSTFALSLLVLILLRSTKLYLHRFAVDEALPESATFQFSLRQLMIVTTLLSVLFAIAGAISAEREGLLVSVLAPCLAAPPLLAAWATLTVSRPRVRIPIALAFSFVLGLAANSLTSDNAPQWFWPSLTLLQGVIATCTLLIVRSCGFRLLRTALQSN